MSDVTVLVNTSDSFEDCWQPFFKLFKAYWPDCPWPVVLNTETKRYNHPGLDIISACVSQGETRRLSWSECLMRCLDRIDSPFVFYLQEDYFLEAAVQTGLLQHMVEVMRAGRADVVRIMECGGSGPWHPTQDPLLWRVDQHARYRIALQAALWRKSVLRSHLRSHESPWQLEAFGSTRARRKRDEKVLCVNRHRFHGAGKEIFPYTPTGVVSGQWERQVVVDLFAREGIEMDFSARGFFTAGQRRKKAPIVRRLSDRLRSLW